MKGKIHFLGIAGSGASAIAAIAQAQGYTISGCDKNLQREFTKKFDPKLLYEGHSADHLTDVEILAVTPAIYSSDANNPELLTAKEKGIKILTWQQFMGKYLEKDKFVIAVCGTHGKSTTTAMVGTILEDAKLDPMVELGAKVPKWGVNYRIGRGKYFVTEADEFNDNFLVSHPDITVVTTLEMDHPEYFKDFEAYKASFAKFFSQTKGKIIANLSDPGVKEALALHPKGGKVIVDYSSHPIDFPLQIPGRYNVLNASAAYQVGLALGINPETIQKSLRNFTGIGRRFDHLGDYQGAYIYSDFAHHPTEIKVTLQAAREKFPKKRLMGIFQPHMFSRTYTLFNDFVRVLKEAPVDKIYIMDIYPSREVDTGKVNSRQLVEAVGKKSVTYLGPQKPALEQIQDVFGKDSVIFFMGAGDTEKLAKEVLMLK